MIDMTIQWLGHSCFQLTSGSYSLVLDPYRDGSVPGLRPLRTRANAVFCSHLHEDHSYAKAVDLLPASTPSPFHMVKVESAHDEAEGNYRGMNTIHVLEAEGLRACHLGDLGSLLSPGQLAAIGRIDALMIPVGGFYTIDAQTAKAVADAIDPRVIIPMHYRGDAFGFDAIGTLEPFLALYGRIDRLDNDTIEIGSDETERVVVLTYAQ